MITAVMRVSEVTILLHDLNEWFNIRQPGMHESKVELSGVLSFNLGVFKAEPGKP